MVVRAFKYLSVWCFLLVTLFAGPSWSQVRERKAINLEAINSPYSDFSPVITPDGNTMYFTSDRPGGAGGQDFWMTRRVGGEWQAPVNLKELNTYQNEGPDSITADGKTMYFTGCNRKKDGSDKCDIYVTNLGGDGKWSKPENLGPPINTEYEECNASISPDGKTLYFSSDRPGGQGGYDIWVSTLKANGKWSEPKNLGSTVNTSGWEGVAFVAADGVTLFFSSNGHGGFGNADVFVTRLQLDGSWSEPDNLGGLINSPYNDIYFTFPASGDWAYFSSSNEEGLGKEDIYAIPKNLILESKDFVVVRGRVTDSSNNQSLAAMMNAAGGPNVKASTTSNPKTGNYSMSLKIGDVYHLTAGAQGYIDRTEAVDLKHADPFHIIVKDFALNPVKVVATTTEQATPEEIEEVLIEGGKLVVRNVLFDFDKYSLRKVDLPILDKLVDFMKNNPTVVLKVDGYTDSKGSWEYNMRLSIRRATAVKNYLAKHGVPPRRMVAEGHSKDNLLEPDDPNEREGKLKNRRVEFSLAQSNYSPTKNPNTTMRGKMPPDVVITQVASAEPGYLVIPEQLTVQNASIATDVVNRVPLETGRQFSSSVGRLYFFTRILGASEDAYVYHLWYFKGKLVKKVEVKVKSPDYRTWSYLNILPQWIGPVRVECVAPNGRVLETIRFTLTQ